MIDWKVWLSEVKRLSNNQPTINYLVLRDTFDLYCEGCSPREAADLLNHYTIVEKEVPVCR